MRSAILGVLMASSLAFPGPVAWGAKAKPEPQPEAKPEAQSEAKPETKAEAKPEAKPETKLDVQPATGSDGKAETKTEGKAEEKKDEGKAFDLNAEGGLHDGADQSRKLALSFMLNLPTWSNGGYFGAGIGFGARFTYPLLPNGFVRKINDSFELEFNADLFDNLTNFSGTLVGFDIAVGARYTLHFTAKIAAYLRVALGFQWATWVNNSFYRWSGGDFFFYDFGPGAEYKILDFLVLRAEVSYTGFHLGAAYLF
jgi:hypothetical protein